MIELNIIDVRRMRMLGTIRLEPSADGTHVDSSVLPSHWRVLVRDMVKELGAEDEPIRLRLEHGVEYRAVFNAGNDGASCLRRMRRKIARILSRRNAAAGN